MKYEVRLLNGGKPGVYRCRAANRMEAAAKARAAHPSAQVFAAVGDGWASNPTPGMI